MHSLLKNLDERLRAEPFGAPIGREARAALFQALDGGAHAFALFDKDDRLAYANDLFREAWNVAPDGPQTFDSILRNCHAQKRGAVVATDDLGQWLARARVQRRDGAAASRAFAVDLWDGRWFWVTEKRLDTGWVMLIGQDITVLKQSESALQLAHEAAVHASLTDTLTQLPNRRCAMKMLQQMLDAKAPFFVALIDLDQFKQINDSYGHAVGDELLVEFGRRLAGVQEQGCQVARLAGDEFAIIGPARARAPEFQRIVNGWLERQRLPYHLVGHSLMVGVSVGIAAAPVDADDVGELLAAADTAMYRAKQSGRYGIRFFDSGMGLLRRDQAELRRDLPSAFAREQFVPYYQPIVDLKSGRILKFEALARWRHPTRGVLTPDRFLPLLTKGEQLTAMTAMLLRQAGTDMAHWDASLRLAFNVSPEQLTRESILPMLDGLRSAGAVPIRRLEMEITESALIANPDEAREVVAAVRRMGLGTSLDDFGVGFSSLKHLRDMSFDRLKLDRSFVEGVGRSRQSRRFLGAMIDLAKKLGLSVIAEGVEDARTVSVLARLGCEYGQGYFYGRPAPADQIDHNRRAPAPASSRLPAAAR